MHALIIGLVVVSLFSCLGFVTATETETVLPSTLHHKAYKGESANVTYWDGPFGSTVYITLLCFDMDAFPAYGEVVMFHYPACGGDDDGAIGSGIGDEKKKKNGKVIKR